jgi:hypothetical protein
MFVCALPPRAAKVIARILPRPVSAYNLSMTKTSLLGSVSGALNKGGLHRISTARKHLYFYLLLILGTIVVGNLRGMRENVSPIQGLSAQTDELKETISQLY